jgi:hypothetical protein
MEHQPLPSFEGFPTKDSVLHTDRLEEKYGVITPEVARHDAEVREAYLNDPEGICRTYALTFFDQAERNSWSEELLAIDAEIQAGGSIGKTFKNHGYEIRKNVVGVYSLKIPTWLGQRFKSASKGFAADMAKARLTEFYAKKPDVRPAIYGTVVEVYTPDFRPAVVRAADLAQLGAMTSTLESRGFTREEVWLRLGLETPWEDMPPLFAEAQEESLMLIEHAKDRVSSYMNSVEHP